MVATHVIFDTLGFVERLKKVGMTEEQAKALLDVQRQSLLEAASHTLATKTDVRHLDKRLDRLEIEMKYIKWASSLLIAGVGALIFKAFF